MIQQRSGLGLGAVLLLVAACVSESTVDGVDADSAALGGASSILHGEAGSSSSTEDPSSGSGSTSQGGTQTGGAGGSDTILADGTGGAGSSEGGAAGVGGSDVGGTAGQGGSSGEAGSGGSAQGGSGGDGGAGGSNQGGTGGSSIDPPPPPACTVTEERCTGLLFESCTIDGDNVQYIAIQCGVDPDVGLNCDPLLACYGECVNGDVRCSGETAEACVSGSWQTTEECAFQCVDGACEGACTPGSVACDGLSRVTCGEDFRYGSPEACPTDPNATTNCTGAGVCGLEPIACTGGTADCDSNWSCETDLSSPDSCGGCGIVCPGATNATRTCNGGVCGLSPNACSSGTANCTGDFACETNTADDESNCGGCGVKCFGTCTAGVCDVETVADLATSNANDWIIDLVLDGGSVYWWTYNAGANTILRAPKTGGAPETLATFALGVGEGLEPRDNVLLVDSGQLYWARSTGIFRVAVTGGTVTKISNQGATALAIDGGKLYWNDNSPAVPTCQDQYFNNYPAALNCNAYKVVNFYTLDLSTLAQTQWQTTQYEYGHVLGVQGGELFVARYEVLNINGRPHYNTAILAVNAATGAWLRSITSNARLPDSRLVYLGLVRQAVFTGTSIVFITGSDVDSGGLYQTPVDSSGNATQVAAYGADAIPPQYIAADASQVYLSLPNTAMRSISRSTSAVQDFFGSPGNAYSKVAVDGSYVYWTVDVGGKQAILRAAK